MKMNKKKYIATFIGNGHFDLARVVRKIYLTSDKHLNKIEIEELYSDIEQFYHLEQKYAKVNDISENEKKAIDAIKKLLKKSQGNV